MRAVSLDVYRAEWTFYKVQAAALESCGMIQLQHFYIFVDEQLLPLGRHGLFDTSNGFFNWHPSDSTLPQCHTGGRASLAPSFLAKGHDLTSR